MKFPLGFIADLLVESGCAIVQRPESASATVEWVSTSQMLGDPPAKDVLCVADSADLVPSGSFGVVVGPPGEGARKDSLFYVEGGPDPATLAGMLQGRFLDVYRWVEAMHNALESHCDCRELLALSEPILKNFASVSDSAFFHIAHTPGIEPIEDASRYLIEHGRYSAETIEAVGRSGLSELWAKSRPFSKYERNAINPKPSIDHVYHLNSQYAAHLVMVCEKPVTAGQEFLFGLLVKPVGTALDYLWRTDNPLKKRYTTFLTDMVHGGGGQRESARRQAEALGIPLSGVFKVCLVAEPLRGSSESYFAERALTLMPGCWAFADKRDVVILMHGHCSSAHGQIAALEERAFGLACDLETQIGVSRKFHDLFEIDAAYEEARIALKYGKARFGEFLVPGDSQEDSADAYVYRFKRYFPYYVGDTHAYKADFMKRHDLVGKVIGPIERDDGRCGTADVQILRTYLRCSCRVQATAEMLGMHRNSVAYRIKHMERAYDLDLSDPDEVGFLQALFLMPR